MELPTGRENAPWNLRVISHPFPLTDLCIEESAFPCLFVIILYLNFILQWSSFPNPLEINGISALRWSCPSSHLAGISRSHTPSVPLNRRQTRVNLNRRDYARSALARFIGNPRARLYGNVGQIYHSGLTVQFSYLRAAGSGSRGLLKNRIPVRGWGETWKGEGGYDQIANKTFCLRFVKLFYGQKSFHSLQERKEEKPDWSFNVLPLSRIFIFFWWNTATVGFHPLPSPFPLPNRLITSKRLLFPFLFTIIVSGLGRPGNCFAHPFLNKW